MRQRKTIGGLLAGLLALTATAPALAEPEGPRLLAPTGPHPVGTTSLHLADTSRADPWVPSAGARELMVSLWYPAKSPNGRRARYMTPTESRLLLEDGGITGVPLDVLSRTRTNAFRDAEQAGRGLPLVVLSPGFTKPRATLSSLAEDLASNGYVVAAVDHTYENVATTFPDGRVATCAACERDRSPEFWEELLRGRAADISFVLDELTGARPKWPGAWRVDPSRIAMAGHSVGGASAIPTMLTDSRVRAGVDIDGTTDLPVPDSGLSRPFLFLGRESTYTPGTPGPVATWERDWARLTGWKRWFVVTGAVHSSFTDVAPLAEQLGVDVGADLAGARGTEITRRYVRAFLDLHVRGKAQPLLDGPSAGYPEVGFCAPEARTCLR